ncbi:hypothetical protein OIN60_05660 [Paenibacillus sp. P96]|uniref:Pectate lyase superfamily protein domain-containing protein n=1 Tax=Paenibacillus zeirhizosphaerae TaxID=2987519 RepID=A0ABT9FNE0_9BACL|nr:hypothetical protein [Paenibacillus sp. P96]MDP4096256.1 hypothetical protein [Paenibacillus sp. P96]
MPQTSIAAEDFGVMPGIDNYTALQNAIDTCADLGAELVLPNGILNISQGIVSTRTNFFIRGRGATVIRTTDPAVTALRLGPGLVGTPLLDPAGYISNLSIQGPSARPTTNSAGLVLNGVRGLDIHNVKSTNFTFGFDLQNNCFRTTFHKVQTEFGSTQVGLLLRGQDAGLWGSGSDLVFINCWLYGERAGVWIHRDGGGYHFYGGQLGMGYNLIADNDAWGCMVIGMDYFDNSKIGVVGNIDVIGIDFEGYHHGWGIRGYGRAIFKSSNCSFLGTSATHMAMGIIKVSPAENGQWGFESYNIDGQFSQTQLAQFSGQGSHMSLYDVIPGFGYRAYANGVQVGIGESLSSQSKLDYGLVAGRTGRYPYIGAGRMRFRKIDAATPQISFDHGLTYSSFPVVRTGTVAPTMNANYIGEEYIDTVTRTAYKAVGTGGGAADWKQITN